MKTALAIALLGLAAPAFAAAAKTETRADSTAPRSSPQKLEKIRKLLHTTHADAPIKLTMDNLRQQMPPAQFAELEQRVKSDEILEFIVAAYDRHFTEKDIDGLIAFYETPLGKKLISEGPAVQRESAEAAQKYLFEKLKSLQPAQPPAQDVPAKSP